MKPGDRFGRLTLVGATDRGHRDHGPLLALRCDCGTETLTLSYEAPLRRGTPSECADCRAAVDRERAGHPYWRTRHMRPESHLVYRAALRSGELVRADECERCGARDTQIVGHHEDYSRPLDVTWLCHPCHSARHDELGNPSARMRRAAAEATS